MYRFNHHTGDNSLRGRETSIDSLSPSNIAVLADAHGKPMQAIKETATPLKAQVGYVEISISSYCWNFLMFMLDVICKFVWQQIEIW